MEMFIEPLLWFIGYVVIAGIVLALAEMRSGGYNDSSDRMLFSMFWPASVPIFLVCATMIAISGVVVGLVDVLNEKLHESKSKGKN